MKKLALILSLISFICFVAVSGSQAQNPKATKETKVEQKVTNSEKPACAHGDKDAKCAKAGEKGHVCSDACKSGEKKGCCADKKGCAKDGKGCAKDKKGEKELK